jgi:ABC-type sugar transport system ATPase subunit
MSSIALDSVQKVFAGGHAAVRDLTLEVIDGELMVLVGPSGCGKSTVLRLIAGLETPTAGRVLLDSVDVTSLPPQRRDLAMVFQSYALYPHLTVRENLAFGLRMRRVAASEVAARIRRVAEALGIEPLLDRKPSQLSGGQRQRVALGRAIVREPRAFLFDEPLSNLDPALRDEMRIELILLHRRLNATMVYVTHDQEEAMVLGERMAILRAGALEQVGHPLQIFQQPLNVFVARFVGSPAMNLIPCSQAHDRSGACVRCAALSIEIEKVKRKLEPTQELLLGVRPHDIEVVAPGDADAIARVEVVEPLGSSTLVHARLSPEPVVRVLVPAETGVAPADEIPLRLRRDRLHLFDAATGRRL